MSVINEQRISNKHYNGLGLDHFIGADGSFQFSKNIDVRRNPKGFQLVPKVNLVEKTFKTTAMYGIGTNFHFNFGASGQVEMNNVLQYTLSGAVTSKEIVNATVFKDYLYMFTKSGVHRIKVIDATTGNWSAIQENYINYQVTGYTQPLDKDFTAVTLDHRNASGVVANIEIYNRFGALITGGYTAVLLPSGYTQITASPTLPNGPFTIHYDFTPVIGNYIPVWNYYDAVMYVSLKNYVLGYRPQFANIPDIGRMIEFESNQEIRGMTAHGTLMSIYCQVDGQNSRQYFWGGEGSEPQSVIHWDGVVIQNVGVYGNYDRVVSNDPRNEISYLWKTQGYERQLMHQGRKKRNSVIDGDFHCTPLSQNFVVKDEICYMPAEQGIYTTGNYYTGFNNAVVREWQWTDRMLARCENLHNSFLYISYEDKTNGKQYVGQIDLNYEFRPTGSGSDAFEQQGELISRIFTGELMYQEKGLKQIEMAYEFEQVPIPGQIELYIRTDRKRPRLLIRTLNNASDFGKNFVRIDPNEIRRLADGYMTFNMLEWKTVIKRGGTNYSPIVYEVNVLYEPQRIDNILG